MVDLVAKYYEGALETHARGKLLDLGCGKAPLYGTYKKYVDENICVDWASGLHGDDYLDFECDLTKALPFEDNEFNTIILSDVLEHIPEPALLWAEMVRILAKDGTLIINVPFCYWIHERPHDYYRYTEFSLRRFADNSGLTLLTLESIGGSPEVFADFLAKHFQFIPFIGKPLAMLIQFIIGVFVKTKIGRRISTKTSEAYPFGYFLVAKK
jgi:SAM-dependent methyltransferase